MCVCVCVCVPSMSPLDTQASDLVDTPGTSWKLFLSPCCGVFQLGADQLRHIKAFYCFCGGPG